MVSYETESQGSFRKKGANTSKWPEEIMAGAIKGLKENGEPVNSKYLEVNHTNLHRAISSYPAGWRTMVRLAGYDPDEEVSELTKIRNRSKSMKESL